MITPAGPLPVYTVVPFVAMLLAIAICPLWVPHWWESNRNKMIVAAALGLPILVLYMIRRPEALGAMAEEYVSFIILLAGLYVIAGGILLRGDLQATPLTNTPSHQYRLPGARGGAGVVHRHHRGLDAPDPPASPD